MGQYLENDGATGSECWSEFPGGHEERVVPRDDGGDDTDRHVLNNGFEAVVWQFDVFVLLFVKFFGHIGIW